MKILSHRGFWKLEIEKNTLGAFKSSIDIGCGFETDIRDFDSNLVISHDPPNASSLLLFSDLFGETHSRINNLTLALNIKSDGLQKLIKNIVKQFNISDYFVFDMSIPDTIGYLENGMNVFLRQSEFETNLPFYSQAKGIWLDCFTKDWYDIELILNHISNGKLVCIVSPELHGRENGKLWAQLKTSNLFKEDRIMLCTDFPDKALEYFL